MTVPFRPTVGVVPERDFLDTVTRAFSEGRAFIERERESTRRAEEFQTQRQNAALAQESLEAQLEAQEFARRREAFADPSLVTSPVPVLGGRAGGPEGGGAQPGAEGLFESALQPPQGQFDQPIGGDIAAPEAPTEPTFAQPEGTGGFTPPPFEGAGGEAIETPSFDVTAGADERPGVPPPAPPTVDTALADELQGKPPAGPREVPTSPQPQLQRVGDIGGQEFFFDPQGEQRADQARLTESGQQVQQVLNGLAAREDAAGRVAEGDLIRDQINEIVALAEGGLEDPSQLIVGLIERTRQNAQNQQIIDVLKRQVGEENLPVGLDDLPPRVQVEQLQNKLRELARPPQQTPGQRGAISEASITASVRQMLLDQSIPPNEATQDQINAARAQVLRFARGTTPEEAGEERETTATTEFRRIASSLIVRIERGLAQLEDSEEGSQLQDDIDGLKSQIAGMEQEQLRQIIQVLSERELDVRSAAGEPNVRGRPETARDEEGRTDELQLRQGAGGGAL